VEASLLPEVNEIRGRAIKIVIFPLALREGFTTTFDGINSSVWIFNKVFRMFSPLVYSESFRLFRMFSPLIYRYTIQYGS
jgi:hypothetical protein